MSTEFRANDDTSIAIDHVSTYVFRARNDGCPLHRDFKLGTGIFVPQCPFGIEQKMLSSTPAVLV